MATIGRELWEKYKQFVVDNVETIGHAESAARILSYVGPGGSAATSELLSATVSLVVLVHDSILRNAANMQLNFKGAEKKIAFCLTVIDHVEVFLEMAACRQERSTARWLVVACVQIIKAVLRFLMLFKYNSGIVASPPVSALKRNRRLYTLVKEQQYPANGVAHQAGISDVSAANGRITFSLKSTGRTVRSLSGGRAAEAVISDGLNHFESTVHVPRTPTKLDSQQLFAESLHILRPLFHLASMYVCGQSSWKPWLLACGLDVTSLLMMGESSRLNVEEREEMKRRTLIMLLYLLRSPFYDRYSKEKLLFFMGVLAHKVPGIRLIVRPLLEYLPIWQQIYFYVWTV